ncbi:MAG TPA: GNVR domain-containing protein [Vicinamibacterales bacterium]|jgi:polysaccharide chain length determinant protein (PEP-CTERM system associated)
MQEPSFDLRSIVATGRRRIGAGLAVAVWVFAAVTTIALVLPDMYRASVVVLVQPATSTDSSAYVNPSDQAARINAHLDRVQQLVLSRPSLESVATQQKLWPDLQQKDALDAAVGQLKTGIAVDPQADSGGAPHMIAISYASADPAQAAKVANALGSAWVAANNQLQKQAIMQSTAFLKAQLDAIKDRLAGQNARIGDFSRQHLGELPQQEQANLAVLGRLSGQLQANLTGQQQLQQQQLQLQAAVAAGASGPDLTHSPAAQLADLQSQLVQLQTRFTDQYPDVIRLKQEIATLKANLTAHAGANLRNASDPATPGAVDLDSQKHMLTEVSDQLKDLRSKEVGLRASIKDYEERLQQAPERGQQLAQLSRDYTTTSDVYGALLKQYEQAQLSSLTDAQHISETLVVSEPAVPPSKPIAPNRPLLIGIGALLAIIAGIIVIFLVDQFDSSFHSVDELKAFTSVPVLATIPRIVTRRDIWRRRGRNAIKAVAVLAVVVLVAAVSYHFANNSEHMVTLLAKVHV